MGSRLSRSGAEQRPRSGLSGSATCPALQPRSLPCLGVASTLASWRLESRPREGGGSNHALSATRLFLLVGDLNNLPWLYAVQARAKRKGNPDDARRTRGRKRNGSGNRTALFPYLA